MCCCCAVFSSTVRPLASASTRPCLPVLLCRASSSVSRRVRLNSSRHPRSQWDNACHATGHRPRNTKQCVCHSHVGRLVSPIHTVLTPRIGRMDHHFSLRSCGGTPATPISGCTSRGHQPSLTHLALPPGISPRSDVCEGIARPVTIWFHQKRQEEYDRAAACNRS